MSKNNIIKEYHYLFTPAATGVPNNTAIFTKLMERKDTLTKKIHHRRVTQKFRKE
jgi:hypothetical protein